MKIFLYFIFLCNFIFSQENNIQNTNDNKSTTEQDISTEKKEESNPKLEKKIHSVYQSLKFGTTDERKTALKEIPSIPKNKNEKILDYVITMLGEDTDPRIKIYCIRVITEVKYEKGYPEIIKLLKLENLDIQREVLSAIKELEYNQAYMEVFEILKKENFTVNSNYLIQLIQTLAILKTDNEDLLYLKNKLMEKSTDEEIKGHIILYLSKKNDSSVVEILTIILKDENSGITVRSYSAYTLAKMNSKESIPSIREVLKKINESNNKLDIKKYQKLKMYCVTSLVQLGDGEVVKDLLNYARDDDPAVRIRALKLLGNVSNPEVIELIEYKSNKDPNPKVQKVAKEVLEKIKNNDKSKIQNDIDITEETNVSTSTNEKITEDKTIK